MTKPLIIFYNPQCAKPGYQRLPAAILQVASLVEERYPYEIVDANLRQYPNYADYIIDKIDQGAKYLAISIMPGPQLNSTVADLRKIKAACPEVTVIVGGYFPLNHTEVCVFACWIKIKPTNIMATIKSTTNKTSYKIIYFLVFI